MVCVFMEFCIHHHKQFWDFFFTPKRPLSCQSSILLLGIYVGAVKSFQNRKIKVRFSFLKDCLQTCNCPRPAMAHVCTHTHTILSSSSYAWGPTATGPLLLTRCRHSDIQICTLGPPTSRPRFPASARDASRNLVSNAMTTGKFTPWVLLSGGWTGWIHPWRYFHFSACWLITPET